MGTMGKVPVRFKRVSDVFDSEVAKARLCDSSGSDHSPDLSDLVNSFLETEYNKKDVDNGKFERKSGRGDGEKLESERVNSDDDYEDRDSLKALFGFQVNDEGVMRSIHGAVKKALVEVGNSLTTTDFKRSLMARLRYGGFDAGLCKSKWEKARHCPSGNYEYIDVLMSGNRYIIEVSLAKEFEIARSTSNYSELLDIFPWIFVGKQEELKQITRLMCKSIKKSMKVADISVPPWRRLAYLQAKWFSSYKRTLNEFPDQQKLNIGDEELRRKRLVGFAPKPVVPFCCRENFSVNVNARVGNLALALNEG